MVTAAELPEDVALLAIFVSDAASWFGGLSQCIGRGSPSRQTGCVQHPTRYHVHTTLVQIILLVVQIILLAVHIILLAVVI